MSEREREREREMLIQNARTPTGNHLAESTRCLPGRHEEFQGEKNK